MTPPRLEEEYIYQEIREQPALARAILDGAPGRFPRDGRTVITGAGDSLVAAELLAGHYPGLGAVALPALAASEAVLSLGSGDTVVGISVSGRTPRVLEAGLRARSRGASLIAVTDAVESPLAEAADEVWHIAASPPEELRSNDYAQGEARNYAGYHHDVAQTKTFLAGLMKMAQAAADALGSTAELSPIPDLLDGLCQERSFSPLREAGELQADAGQTFVLAAGPFLPLARFGAYKLFEYNRVAHFADLEEYCHTHYFITRPGDAIVLLAPDEPSAFRASEIGSVLEELFDARVVCLHAAHVEPPHLTTGRALPLPPTSSPIETALGMVVAIEWLTYFHGRVGAPDINRFHAGYDADRLVGASMRTIRKSKVRE